MFKRIFALALCCILLAALGMVRAEESNIPEGLEPMYALMDERNDSIVGVANAVPFGSGKALLSYAISYTSKDYTAEEILAAVPNALVNLGKKYDLRGENATKITEKYGIPVVEISTSFWLGDLPVNGECLCFSAQSCVVEAWLLSPDASYYAQDETAVGELEADLTAAHNLLDTDGSLRGIANGSINILTGKENLAASSADTAAALPESETYTDPDGYFRLQVVKGARILTPSSSEEEISLFKEEFLAAFPEDPEGAERWFALLKDDLLLEKGTLIFSPDLRSHVSVFREEHPEYIGNIGIIDLASNADSIRANLEKEYGGAELELSFEKENVSGMDHARACFHLTCGTSSIHMGLLDTITDADVIWEEGIFSIDEASYHSLYRLTVETMEYLK